jgi:hypothetical protein
MQIRGFVTNMLDRVKIYVYKLAHSFRCQVLEEITFHLTALCTEGKFVTLMTKTADSP